MRERGSDGLVSARAVRALRRAAAGVVLGLLAVLAAPRALAADIAGVWLIDSDSFDTVVESGLDVAAWPVLVVRDGAFRLYRLHVPCTPFDDQGAEIADPHAAAAMCFRAAGANAADGLGASARLLVAGAVEEAPSRVRFVPRTVAPVPAWWRRETAQLVERGRPAGMAEADWRFVQAMLAGFYTTFHVGDGAWLAARLDGDTLTIEPEAGGEALGYVRADAASLAATMGALNVLQLSGAKYFRCLYEVMQGTRQSALSREELARLAALGAHGAAMVRRDHALGLRAAGDRAAADAIWSAADEDRFVATEAALRANPLVTAETPGRTFGCPDRDGVF